MNKTIRIAAAGIAMLLAGSEAVRAEDGGEHAVNAVEEAHLAAITPWESRETGQNAPTAEDRRELRRQRYTALISKYADEYDVPVELAHAVVQIESNFRPTITGSAGEIGLMQVKPATAKLMGYKGPAYGLYDPETNIQYGMKYLAGAHDLGGGKVCGTILKYNAGHGAKRMNPISQRYCNRVQDVLAQQDLKAMAAAVSYNVPSKGYLVATPLVF